MAHPLLVLESDARPMHICPICLRKRQMAAGFEVAEQHRRLKAFYDRCKFTDEAAFMSHRLEWMLGQSPAKNGF